MTCRALGTGDVAPSNNKSSNRAFLRFTARHERLFQEIENAASACGANEHTRRAHEALTAAQCAMQACLAEFGRPTRPK